MSKFIILHFNDVCCLCFLFYALIIHFNDVRPLSFTCLNYFFICLIQYAIDIRLKSPYDEVDHCYEF